MPKHARPFAAALATSVAVSLSVFGLATSASATESVSLPTIESATFNAACFIDNEPGVQGAISVVVPEGFGPVVVTVEYASGEILFGETITASAQVIGGGPLPLGDYDLTVLLNGVPTGGGLASAVDCEDVANPGGGSDNPDSGPSVPTPIPDSAPAPEPAPELVPVVAPEVVVTTPAPSEVPVANIVPKGHTDGYEAQSASSESMSPGVGVAAVSALLLGLIAAVGWRRKTLAGK